LFYEGLDSKFPRWLKHLQLIYLYIRKQITTTNQLAISLKPFLGDEVLDRLGYIKPTKWFFYLLKAWAARHLYFAYFRTFNNNADRFLDEFAIDNIRCGDLIIDSFTRYKGVPNFDISHKFVYSLIIQAKALNLFYNHLLEKSGAASILYCSYTTYLQWGIPSRIAIKKNARVVTLGSSRCLFRVNFSDRNTLLCAHPNHVLFNKSRALELPPVVIEEAQKILHSRLDGKYDKSMSYMSNNTSHEAPKSSHLKNKNLVVIMLHAFNDSVHIYRWFCFKDFWDWATKTIEYLSTQGYHIIIKPHPNHDRLSVEAKNELCSLFSNQENLTWISENTPNSIIFAARPLLVITGYGSVIFEAGFAGIKTVVAGDHPAINFNIAKTPRSQQEYFKEIKNALTTPHLTNQQTLQMKRDCVLALASLMDAEDNQQLMSKFNKSRDSLEDVKFLQSEEVVAYLEPKFDELAKILAS
tara:strand:- start:2709 stop:4112 length:1404 start_codon:yes stop_codon:yes gene_type:complete